MANSPSMSRTDPCRARAAAMAGRPEVLVFARPNGFRHRAASTEIQLSSGLAPYLPLASLFGVPARPMLSGGSTLALSAKHNERSTPFLTKANPPRGGDAKPRVRSHLIAGLPRKGKDQLCSGNLGSSARMGDS